MGIWLGWDNIAQIISDSQTSTTSPATPSRTRALSIPPTATPAAAIPLTPTEVLTASPTPIPTNTPTPRYTTKHGKALPLIDTDILEDTIVSLVNDVRLMDNLESLVRVSSLDDLATAHSRHMADSQQAKARPLETGCGGSGTHIVQWPQVKSFSYRGPAAVPTTTTPTEYNETAKETAAGVVGYIHEGDVPYTKDPHYRYVGVGVVQSPDELGFMVFWITMYVADCVAEAPAATSTATATPPPSPTPIATVPPTVTNTPTATDTPSPTPTPTQTAASFSLGGFTNGRWLEQQDPQLAFAIRNLGWVRDGIDERESEVIQDLLYIAVTSRSVVASIVSLGWVQDGIHDVEAGAVRWLDNMGSAEVASSVVSLGWVEDGIEEIEVKAIEEISYIANADTDVASSIVSLAWMQDGIDMLEAGAIYWMRNIGSAEVASSVVSLAWMQDGIDDVEVKTIEELSYIANRDAGVGLSVVSLGWVQDGIDDVEVKTIEELSYIANRDAGSALRIVGMPFLETIEPPDISAMESLRQLAAFKPSAFVSVMSHKALRDGISNDLAPIVATLDGVAETNPSLIDILLDPSRVLLERRIITLPLAGDVVLSIVRTGPGAARSMDLLEHAVRSVEEYMDAPFPTSYVGLLYENAVFGSNAGTNFGTHIAILPEYDVDDGSHEAEFAGSAIAHEVTHYYWSGNADWVDEGAADLMASIVEGARTGRPVGVTNPPCAYARTIAELESLGISRVDVEFGCNYSLGERLFVDLRRTLGDERFRQGFRALYLASELEDAADDRRGTSVGIEHIREAFRSDDRAESAVIARWYDGTQPYDLSRLDPGPVDPGLPGIDGRVDDAYIITSQGGPPVSAFSARDVADWVYVTLEYSYALSGGTREVPLEIVEYYEDGFEFSRRSSGLTAEARYTGGTSWFPVGVSPPRKWAAGRYVVYVYANDRKVAEVEYEVTP